MGCLQCGSARAAGYAAKGVNYACHIVQRMRFNGQVVTRDQTGSAVVERVRADAAVACSFRVAAGDQALVVERVACCKRVMGRDQGGALGVVHALCLYLERVGRADRAAVAQPAVGR